MIFKDMQLKMKDVKYFEPNMVTHAAFGEALKEASEAGVKVLAYDCEVTKDSIVTVSEILPEMTKEEFVRRFEEFIQQK